MLAWPQRLIFELSDLKNLHAIVFQLKNYQYVPDSHCLTPKLVYLFIKAFPKITLLKLGVFCSGWCGSVGWSIIP